ncbi:hypothetical protein FJT64_002028 [Amphibalanus amphitrite]|uniref:Uncharacterized protein n=1 Tax=Amphibalanus amphitrite TaxID=1232801 RepID=A0A6A4X7H6_AMPAM|nr:hypothetical protein FJT64_002028 [Amphibalanus amphitrite]
MYVSGQSATRHLPQMTLVTATLSFSPCVWPLRLPAVDMVVDMVPRATSASNSMYNPWGSSKYGVHQTHATYAGHGGGYGGYGGYGKFVGGKAKVYAQAQGSGGYGHGGYGGGHGGYGGGHGGYGGGYSYGYSADVGHGGYGH